MLSERLWVHDVKVIAAQVTNGHGFLDSQEESVKAYRSCTSAVPVLEHLRRLDVITNGEDPGKDQTLKDLRFAREFWGLGVYSFLSPTSFRVARGLIQHFVEKKTEIDALFAQAVKRASQRSYDIGFDRGKVAGWFGYSPALDRLYLEEKILPKDIINLDKKKTY